MAEYLSPGVYVEEFESGPRPMAGVSTSTVGFIGMAERGPVSGPPQLITSSGEFTRRYGGCLPKAAYENYSYLAHAVDHFFLNGGARCYVMRVSWEDAAAASGSLMPCGMANAMIGMEGDGLREGDVVRFKGGLNKSNLKSSPTDRRQLVLNKEGDVVKGDVLEFTFKTASNPTAYRMVTDSIDLAATLNEALKEEVAKDIKDISFCNLEMEFKRNNETLHTEKDIMLNRQEHLKFKINDSAALEISINQAEFQKRWETHKKHTMESLDQQGVYTIKTLFQMTITASDPGKWGNQIKVASRFFPQTQKEDGTVPYGIDLMVSYEGQQETYQALSSDPESPDFISRVLEKSSGLIKVKMKSSQVISGKVEINQSVTLSGGSDGTKNLNDNTMLALFRGTDTDPEKRTGLAAFQGNDTISLLCAPGVTAAGIQGDMVSHCEKQKNRFAILDIKREDKTAEQVLAHRQRTDSDYAAMYHPWLMMYDPVEKKNNPMPPSGAIAGIYARSDQERGVHKAPANEIVRGAMGLDVVYSQGEQDILNPKGVNLIRSFPGQGIRVWGARTCSSNTLWKYVNVRRLFIYLEESIRANTNWVVFEPNDELLWLRVQRTIDVFLNNTWRSGALAGSTPEEAYYIRIGRSTMTQNDIDNGRLICEIGVAPVKPAEFVIFRLTQKTSEKV